MEEDGADEDRDGPGKGRDTGEASDTPDAPDERDSIWSRRDFVRGAVVGAGAAATGALGLQLAASTLGPLTRPPTVTYRGALNVGGPAPRPQPLIPVEVADGGYIFCRSEHLDWLYYCGMEMLPGLRADDPVDELVRYGESPYDEPEAWFADRRGEAMRRDHFVAQADAEEGGAPVGAVGTWRGPPGEGVPVVVIYMGDAAPDVPEADAGFLAAAAKCVHLCCVAEVDLSPYEVRASRDADGKLFCRCHGAVFDPAVIVERQYRPSWPDRR